MNTTTRLSDILLWTWGGASVTVALTGWCVLQLNFLMQSMYGRISKHMMLDTFPHAWNLNRKGEAGSYLNCNENVCTGEMAEPKMLDRRRVNDSELHGTCNQKGGSISYNRQSNFKKSEERIIVNHNSSTTIYVNLTDQINSRYNKKMTKKKDVKNGGQVIPRVRVETSTRNRGSQSRSKRRDISSKAHTHTHTQKMKPDGRSTPAAAPMGCNRRTLRPPAVWAALAEERGTTSRHPSLSGAADLRRAENAIGKIAPSTSSSGALSPLSSSPQNPKSRPLHQSEMRECGSRGQGKPSAFKYSVASLSRQRDPTVRERTRGSVADSVATSVRAT